MKKSKNIMMMEFGNQARVYNAVGKWITEAEYEEITGEKYK